MKVSPLTQSAFLPNDQCVGYAAIRKYPTHYTQTTEDHTVFRRPFYSRSVSRSPIGNLFQTERIASPSQTVYALFDAVSLELYSLTVEDQLF